jgi:hypothetical protein
MVPVQELKVLLAGRDAENRSELKKPKVMVVLELMKLVMEEE